MIAFYASTFDAITMVVASYSEKMPKAKGILVGGLLIAAGGFAILRLNLKHASDNSDYRGFPVGNYHDHGRCQLCKGSAQGSSAD